MTDNNEDRQTGRQAEGHLMALKTWFITGTSRGFGREWALAALDRGDKVAATARDSSTLDDLVAKYGDAILPIQLETNVLGALWITQAALPYLREQGSGHILQVSSIGGISAFRSTGAYHASKWALEGLSQSLAQEVAGFGVKVTLIEPAGYSTDWSGSWREWQPVAAAARGTVAE
jgi:NAD(P)-dependent dehydrogenase (short-subunit alcohol dehydrogenase family)